MVLVPGFSRTQIDHEVLYEYDQERISAAKRREGASNHWERRCSKQALKFPFSDRIRKVGNPHCGRTYVAIIVFTNLHV